HQPQVRSLLDGDDVIDLFSRFHDPLLQACLTKWILRDELISEPIPPPVVPPRSRGPSSLVVSLIPFIPFTLSGLGRMTGASTLSGLSRGEASWLSACPTRSAGHSFLRSGLPASRSAR